MGNKIADNGPILGKLDINIVGNLIYPFLNKQDQINMGYVSSKLNAWSEFLVRKGLIYQSGFDTLTLTKALLNEKKFYTKDTFSKQSRSDFRRYFDELYRQILHHNDQG